MNSWTDEDLAAYLDEALPALEMALVEQALRDDAPLVGRLVSINARRDNGQHTLGEVWRRNRPSCPSRAQLGSYLLGVLSDAEARFVRLHLDEVGCRVCQANVADLREEQQAQAAAKASRRKRYFESSAGFLRGE